MPYRIQLQNFEGPLDLLLFLIRKNEVDIYDIPISEITQQFLQYLEVIELLDLDQASEFVLMAATLIRIKARMLLPKPELDDDEEAEDPRQELVQRLLEYQRYKEVAWDLRDREEVQKNFFQRGSFHFDYEENEDSEEFLNEKEVTMFDLMSVFLEILKRVPPVTSHTVQTIPVTIDEQSEHIMNFLQKQKKVLFTELFADFEERIILIVTFIALLELVKNRSLILNQANPFSEMWICRN